MCVYIYVYIYIYIYIYMYIYTYIMTPPTAHRLRAYAVAARAAKAAHLSFVRRA